MLKTVCKKCVTNESETNHCIIACEYHVMTATSKKKIINDDERIRTLKWDQDNQHKS